MVTKKDALALGILVVGGIGAASMIADSGNGGGGVVAKAPRAGGILGSTPGMAYNIPAQPSVTFPETPTFDISKFFIRPEEDRRAAGVSAAPKKIGLLGRSPGTGVTPYLHTGGEVGLGAYTHAPSPGTGVTPYLHTGGEVGLGAYTVYGADAPIKTKKKVAPARAASPGRMGMGRSFAASHGGDS